MKKSEQLKALKHEDAVDFISSMPDPILVLILSDLPCIIQVLRTSILSTRWRYLWTLVPNIFLDVDDLTSGVKEFVYWVLVNQSVNLDTFRLCCSDEFSMSTVARWIHIAVSRKVKKLDLTFWPETDTEEIEMPHCLLNCGSLEVLMLCSDERRLRLPKNLGFPALRVLELSYVCLLEDEDLVKSFLQSLQSLEDLSLIACFINELELLHISCPKLKKLKIENDENVRMCGDIKISCPKQEFLALTGPIADNFYFESLDSLKEAVFEPEDLMFDTKCVLFPGISHVESLRINLNIFCLCIDAAIDPGLPNLKTLVLTTTVDAFNMDELNRILKYYPKLESLSLVIKKMNSVRKMGKSDEAEIRRILTDDVNRVEFVESNGEKPSLVTKWDRDSLREMFFSWGKKSRFSHWIGQSYKSNTSCF